MAVTTATIVALLGNTVVLIAAVIGAMRWFKKWLVRTVSDPIHTVLKTLEELATSAKEDAHRANDRIDRLLEVRSNA